MANLHDFGSAASITGACVACVAWIAFMISAFLETSWHSRAKAIYTFFAIWFGLVFIILVGVASSLMTVNK